MSAASRLHIGEHGAVGYVESRVTRLWLDLVDRAIATDEVVSAQRSH